MVSRVDSSALLAAGLRTEFADTYEKAQNRMNDGRVAMLMDMSLSTQTRETPFGYHEAPPHIEYWPRGTAVPTESFGSVTWTTPIYEWSKRIPFSKFDRKDEQTDTMLEMARMLGASAGALEERFNFDLLTGTAGTLPAIPTAPDGAALFSATDAAGRDRFGVSGGNLISGSGVASLSAIITDYYTAIARWRSMKDRPTGGQFLFSPEVIDQGVLIVHGSANEKIFEEAFRQIRQGVVLGTDAGTTPTNIIQDASRNVDLWSTARITDNDWFVYMKGSPKQPFYLLDREGVQEYTALADDNNSDHVRTYGEEYIQFERRAGAGIALPYGICKVNN